MKLALLALGAFIASLAGTAVTVMMVSDPESVPAPAHAENDEQATGDTVVVDALAVSGDSTSIEAADSVAGVTQITDTTQTAQGEVAPEDDSAPADGASSDSGTVDAPVDASAPAISPPSSAAAIQGSTMLVAADAGLAAEEESARQTARIFSAMQASNAAAVLVHLSDKEIVRILKFFNARKAAAVLSEFPDERAASISRALLRRRDIPGGRQ